MKYPKMYANPLKLVRICYVSLAWLKNKSYDIE